MTGSIRRTDERFPVVVLCNSILMAIKYKLAPACTVNDLPVFNYNFDF